MNYPMVVIDVQPEDKKPRSVPELAKLLQRGEVDPSSLDKETLERCAMYFRVRGVPNELIASYLHKDERTIRRYLKAVKSRNNLSRLAQADYIAGLIDDIKEQKLRALKFVYDNDLKPGDILKAMALVHTLDMDRLEILARFGYIDKHQAKVEAAEAVEKQKPPKSDDPEMDDLMSQLSPMDRTAIAFLLKQGIGRLQEEIEAQEHAESDIIEQAKARAREIIAEKQRRIMAANAAKEAEQREQQDVRFDESKS